MTTLYVTGSINVPTVDDAYSVAMFREVTP